MEHEDLLPDEEIHRDLPPADFWIGAMKVTGVPMRLSVHQTVHPSNYEFVLSPALEKEEEGGEPCIVLNKKDVAAILFDGVDLERRRDVSYACLGWGRGQLTIDLGPELVDWTVEDRKSMNTMSFVWSVREEETVRSVLTEVFKQVEGREAWMNRLHESGEGTA